VNVCPEGIVGLRIVDHEPEISLESSPVFVEATVEFRAHGTQVHRVLNDLEVTERMVVSVAPRIGGLGRTLGPYHGRDQRAGGRVERAYVLAAS
jgi:hypothetical protein